ncbi:MAG: MmcQ/YjbR family DNA-binding protein, partial [Rhodospirillaceae bacterium]|nr:MmcQ/YjbR family DNA-binding protein [Rhodospirillaceae bacterium]
MNYDEFNAFCGALPATSHVVQWGGSHVWKVGGKVFAVGGWNKVEGVPAFKFKVSPVSYEILQEQTGLRPATYLAARGLKCV